ncbi:MAG TPA: ABC transporter substrate-binding protein [Anaerolineae bacterium]|nr:ABC transporter substrate-binding protein [Anaerolineae bacterium]
MKSRFVLSLLLVVAVLMAGCQPAAAPTAAPTAAAPAGGQQPAAPAAGGTLKLAILAPLSGSQPTFGVSTRDGALMAIDEWNAKGGVLGMKIEADVADSQCEADPAVNAANKVIDQDKVHYIVGEVCSKASIPISEIANQKKVVQISPTSTNPQVTTNIDGSTKPFTFRACFIDPFQGTVAAKFAQDNLKAKTAFIMFDQGNDYVRGLAEAFEAAFTKAGGQIVGKESYTSNDKDFSAILAKVAAAKPDMLYLPDYYPIVNLVGAQAKDKGITIPMMGGDGWDSGDLDVKAADNGYYTNHYDPSDPRQIVQDFVKAYSAKYKDDKGQPKVPDALAALAYDATDLMLAAIQKAGVDDPTAVAKAMEGLKYDAVSGTVTFDAQHNPIKSAVIIQVKDGKKTVVASVAP